MSSTQEPHPLTVKLASIGQSGYPAAENIDIYLDALYKAGLFETLAASHPGTEVIRNLADAYAILSDIIFWQEDPSYDEALRAFPLFANYVAETHLSLSDLHNITEIVGSFFDWEANEKGPDHLGALTDAIQTLQSLFYQQEYKTRIYSALKEQSYAEFGDLIAMANWFYQEDEFELFFIFAQDHPLRALSNSYWLMGMTSKQRQRFILWARRFLPPTCLDRPIEPMQQISEVEKRILDRVIFHEEYLLIEQNDRRDFATWGLCSVDKVIALDAAYLLEELPVSQWPRGSREVIAKLLDQTEAHWASIKRKGGKAQYVNSKDRLNELLGKSD